MRNPMIVPDKCPIKDAAGIRSEVIMIWTNGIADHGMLKPKSERLEDRAERIAKRPHTTPE